MNKWHSTVLKYFSNILCFIDKLILTDQKIEQATSQLTVNKRKWQQMHDFYLAKSKIIQVIILAPENCPFIYFIIEYIKLKTWKLNYVIPVFYLHFGFNFNDLVILRVSKGLKCLQNFASYLEAKVKIRNK